MDQLKQFTPTSEGLHAEFVFPDFIAAWGFMSKIALIAERHQHHPSWKNTYNRVEILLNTHDENNAITHKDYELAVAIEKVWKT